MRAVVQRVSKASVKVDSEVVGSIGNGLLVLLGVGKEDTAADVDYLVGKITRLRIFADEEGKMNRDVLDAGGGLLIISQFTLFGDCRRGRRPSFDKAAGGHEARALYEYFVERARKEGIHVETGVFQAYMAVESINDGPVTILFDSSKLF